MSPASPERRQPEFAAPPRRLEPAFSPPPAPPAPKAGLLEKTGLLESDAAVAAEHVQFAGAARLFLERLAGLASAPDAPTPFAIGLLAPAGGGKSSSLNWLAEQIAERGAVAVRLDAAELAQSPELVWARALYRALTPKDLALVEAAAAEAREFRADAGALHRAAREKLDAARRQLIVEKQALASSESRRAALKEKLLYDQPGARVDLFLRRIKTGFTPRLRRFGFTGEALASLRDLVRDMSDRGGRAARALASLRGLYAFRGQTRLLVYAALSYAAGLGLDWTLAHQAALLDQLAGFGATAAQAADMLRGQAVWLAPAAKGFGGLALALVALNLWRAFAFMQPLLHGATLLDRDLADHRRDVEQTLAVQARHVEQSEAEIENLSRQAAEAERRANIAGAHRSPPAFMTDEAPQRRILEAIGFNEALSRRLDGLRSVVAVVDGLERLGDPVAALAQFQPVLAQHGFGALIALDPAWFDGRPDELARRIQLPLRLDRVFSAEEIALAPLDSALSSAENRLIAAVAPLAGAHPRAQKRWRNYFRFLRPASGAGAPDGLTAALALLLAAEAGAEPLDREILRQALAAPSLAASSGDFAPKAAVGGSPALQAALGDLAVLVGPIGLDQARRAAALARQLEA